MYQPYPYYLYPIDRPYPTVDISMFQQSVTAYQQTLREAGTILNKLAEPQFARLLMSAAQAGNRKEVDRIIRTIGTRTPIETQYTPTGLSLTLHAQPADLSCCTLTMYLRWGR
ncbi:hypothetical protein [Cohnella candidum]|uniref:Uncharacterized protein n=1 Tax=Cohnella candidum TaxID=2674991 RepID=A0A3G3JZP4_9BACL|nr:hypothetical protein [Cohnella candidum]AYQ73718.1 hypothetical protein EAV92_14700 [Cohnella candidum]